MEATSAIKRTPIENFLEVGIGGTGRSARMSSSLTAARMSCWCF